MSKSRIECFFLEPTKTMEESLRRYYTGEPKCTKFYYHNTEVILGRVPAPEGQENGMGRQSHPNYPHDHPKWPRRCECGYVYREEDEWQHNLTVLYRAMSGPHEGTLFTLRNAPVGAMWDAGWMGKAHQGPDGRCLMVKTPGGDWCIDGKSSNGNGWTRTGELPKITVKPSIGIGRNEKGGGWKYHGFLTDGFLVEC
jgi:hypothetical protein